VRFIQAFAIQFHPMSRRLTAVDQRFFGRSTAKGHAAA
jgi:hypothetical protein